MTDVLQNSTARTEGEAGGWMADVQRALGLLIIGLLVMVTFLLTCRLVWTADTATIADLVKVMLAALVNMGLIALGFFFGSSQSKEKADTSQQKIMEKLTSSVPPATGPVAPVVAAAPIIVVSWWSLLTDKEREAIKEASTTSSVASTFMAAAQSGKATDADLANLVTAGLLTQQRADEVRGLTKVP